MVNRANLSLTLVGGLGVLEQITKYGGASSYLVDAYVPYSMNSSKKLGQEKVNKDSAREFALNAYGRALENKDNAAPCYGLGCTSVLAKHNQRPGRKNHAYISFCYAHNGVRFIDYYQEFNLPDRGQQESQLAYSLYAILNDINNIKVVQGELKWNGPKLNENVCIFPGSFNPVHEGHIGIINECNKRGYQTLTEISLDNWDKPEKDLNNILNTYRPNIISRLPTFLEKISEYSQSGCITYAMGLDTFERIPETDLNVMKDKVKLLVFGNVESYESPSSWISFIPYECDTRSSKLRCILNN